MGRQPPSLFLTHLRHLQDQGRTGPLIAQALRLPLAEAERLALVAPQPWGRLAWRIEANRRRWERLQGRRDGR